MPECKKTCFRLFRIALEALSFPAITAMFLLVMSSI